MKNITLIILHIISFIVGLTRFTLGIGGIILLFTGQPLFTVIAWGIALFLSPVNYAMIDSIEEVKQWKQ